MTFQRISSEVGDCVTNPAKRDIESQGQLHLTDPVSKFCTSYVLVNVELERFIDAWIPFQVQESFALALSVDVAEYICRKLPL